MARGLAAQLDRELIRDARGLSAQGLSVSFFLQRGTPREPVHIHVESADGKAKFWLRPEVRVASESGYDRKTLAELTWIIRKERDRIERRWNEHFGG